MKVCAVVVFYNPEGNTYQNILSYIQDVDKVFVIDNSTENNYDKLSNSVPLEKIEYIAFLSNKGLAYALNYGCKKAIEEGFEYCLTMDQDSVFEKYAVKTLRDFMYQTAPKYAAVCPNIRAMVKDGDSEKESFLIQKTTENQLCSWTMTSGTLMSLKTYEEIGGFDEKLFIGHIDVEFGFQLRQINEKIMIVGQSILRQYFGNAQSKKLLWKNVNPYFGSPIRVYYTWRNEKYLRLKYGIAYTKYIHIKLWKSLIKILLYEPNKLAKIRMMIRGYSDAKNCRMGMFKENRSKF